jgi:SAM domain (Sterile alpha motif)
MLLSVRRFTTLSSVLFVGEWLHHLGYGHLRESFASQNIDLYGLLHMTMPRLGECGVDIWDAANEALLLAMEDYKKFSSVDETFRWLRESSFQKVCNVVVVAVTGHCSSSWCRGGVVDMC